MAHIIADRVLEQSTTAGLGAFTLAGAALGYRAFAAVCSVADTAWYYIEAVDSLGKPSGAYEYGIGTYSGANTLTRTTVIGSSNSGSPVDFAAGTKLVGIGVMAPGSATINAYWRKALGLPVSVTDYGATGDGTTNDTTAIQLAFTTVRTAGGGSVYFPPGTYIVDRSIRIGSKTRVYGSGASSIIKAHQSAYVGVNGGAYATQNCQLLQNYNFSAGSLTDTDIIVEDLSFNWGTVTIAGGGAHSIAMRMVDRVTVRGVYSTKGENVTAFLGCKDTLVENCDGLNVTNCFYDHWDGASSASVINCVGRITSGTIQQGIQFTGTGSYAEALSSVDALVMGCSLYGVRNAGSSSAIIANANQAASSAYRLRSIGNYIEDSDIGVCFQGAGNGHLSMGDTLKGVTKLPIFFNTDASGYPGYCRVIDPHLIDCNHLVGNVALISIGGTGHQVKGVKVSNTGAAAYLLIGYMAAGATSCLLEIDSAPNGSAGGRINNSGTTCTVVDKDILIGMPKQITVIASAATIAPVNWISYVSGTAAISTITPPTGVNQGGTIILIPQGLWTLTTGGNIQIASSAVVSKAMTLVYDKDAAKWFPSY